MRNTIFFVVLALMGLLFLLYRKFRKVNNKLKVDHMEIITYLIEKISLNKEQIKIRRKGLNRYDLLKHNLNDSLIVQESIDIRTK